MISKLYFRGRSTADFSGVTVAEMDYGDLESKRADEDITGRDGTLTSHANGRHYKARQMTIVFNVRATPTTIEGVIASLRDWLSEGTGELSDDFNAGKVWKNAEFVSAHTDYIDMFRGCARLTAIMTADPVMRNAGEVNERILKFAANGGATINLTDNSAYSITIGEDTVTGTFTAAAPYRYRLVAYAENPVAVTRDGAAMTSDVFTLANATDDTTIAIAAAQGVTAIGYGYYELWHDTRGVST